jgi:hypothetical protein
MFWPTQGPSFTLKLVKLLHFIYSLNSYESILKSEEKILLLCAVCVYLIGIVGVESNWVHSALRPPMAYWPAPGDYDDGEIGGMIGRRNQGTRRKPDSVPFCPPQIPHAARTRTRAAAVGSKRLTA